MSRLSESSSTCHLDRAEQVETRAAGDWRSKSPRCGILQVGDPSAVLGMTAKEVLKVLTFYEQYRYPWRENV